MRCFPIDFLINLVGTVIGHMVGSSIVTMAGAQRHRVGTQKRQHQIKLCLSHTQKTQWSKCTKGRLGFFVFLVFCFFRELLAVAMVIGCGGAMQVGLPIRGGQPFHSSQSKQKAISA